MRRLIENSQNTQLWALFKDTEVRSSETPFFTDRNDRFQINRRLHGSSRDFGIDTTIYYKDYVINAAVVLTTTVLGFAILVGVLWLLDQNSSEARFAVISGFLIVFTIILSMLTAGRFFEVLAGTGAAVAVLAVLM